MNFTQEGGGFEKVVWENCLETLAGGVMLDLTGYTVPADGQIPAGTLIGAKNATTGLHPILTDGSANPIGFTTATHKAFVTGNTRAEVGISGSIRKKALPQASVVTAIAAVAAKLPRISIV